MDAGINIFLNGISGVFLGMAVLYVTIKIIGIAAAERSEPEDKG